MKPILDTEFEIAYAVNFLHSMGVLCEPSNLRPFYANYPELPLADNVFMSNSEKLQLEGRTLKVYKKHHITGVMALLTRIELATFTKPQTDNLYACWAWTQHKNKVTKMEQNETKEIEEKSETLENRIDDGVVILWSKFGIQADANKLAPYYGAETAIPDGGVVWVEGNGRMYVKGGELIEERTEANAEPETVGAFKDSPRAVIIGGNTVRRRALPLSQLPAEHLEGLFALWAWNKYLEDNGNEPK